MPNESALVETTKTQWLACQTQCRKRRYNRFIPLFAVVFTCGFILIFLPKMCNAANAIPWHRLSHKLLKNDDTNLSAEWFRKGTSSSIHRRHKFSQTWKKKLENMPRIKPDQIMATSVRLELDEDERQNGFDARGYCNGTYEYDDEPGIWKILRTEMPENGVPAWKRLPSVEKISRFRQLVQQTLGCRKLPALSLALVKRGHVLLTANLGHSDAELLLPVSHRTRFAIGSLTKAFTATLVLEIFKRYNLSLDTPIDQFMPGSFQLMDEVRTRSISVRDLLGHRTGVPGYFHALLTGFPKHITRRQLLRRLRYIPAVVPLRSQFLYNNYMYTLAAHVVEKLTGRSWEQLVSDIILRPLGMTCTGFVNEVDDFSQFALPCASLNGTLKNLSPELLLSVSPCGPAGSLYSTALDMGSWLQLLLSNGKSRTGTRLLHEGFLKETTRPVMPPPGIGTDLTKPEFPISDIEQSYGMGWVTSNYRGFRKVWHSGGIVTYSSRLWLFPGVEAGLFVATNGPQTRDKGHALTVITSLAADLLLGEKFWLNSSTICSFPVPWRTTEALATEPSSPALTAEKASEANVKKPPSSDTKEEDSQIFSERVTRRQSRIDQLLGVYDHKAFGKMVIERGKSDASSAYGSENVETKREESKYNMTDDDDNATAWLMLKYGRFGQLKLKRVKGSYNKWEGMFIGPLWYVTASDEHNSPVSVQFLRDEAGNVDRIRYPIDSEYDVIEFQKLKLDATSSSSFSSSCNGSMYNSVVPRVVALYLLKRLLLKKLLSSL